MNKKKTQPKREREKQGGNKLWKRVCQFPCDFREFFSFSCLVEKKERDKERELKDVRDRKYYRQIHDNVQLNIHFVV